MAKIKTLVIASGYFNPLHKGHIEYLQRSKELGNKLAVTRMLRTPNTNPGTDNFLKKYTPNKYARGIIKIKVRVPVKNNATNITPS